MTDDDRLLDVLGRALAPPPVEPPAERVAAFRALIAQGRPAEAEETDSAAAGTEEAEQGGDVRQLPPIVDVRPARAAARPAVGDPTPAPTPTPPAPPPPAVPELARHRARRVGWLAAGASVAAAAVVMVVLAVPNLMTDRSRPETSVETARAAVARLRTALALGDPIAVAEADAELVRVAGQLPHDEQRQVRNDTVAAHVEAIEFLRENRPPSSPAPPPGGQMAAPTAPVVPVPEQAPPTTAAPVGDPATTSPPPPDSGPAPPPPARSVTIIVVSPQVDGTFEVLFATSGFSPEPGRKPGTYAIRFSFDNGQSPTIWTKSEPWRFRGEHAVTYRQVCAHVVDANGVADPASGGCRSIL